MNEGDLSQKLDQVLSDPARMAQIAALAKSFAGGTESPPKEAPSCEEGERAPSLLSFLPPEFLRDWKAHAPERIALLRAVRPFLEPERRVKVDRILATLRTLDLLTALKW